MAFVSSLITHLFDHSDEGFSVEELTISADQGLFFAFFLQSSSFRGDGTPCPLFPL